MIDSALLEAAPELAAVAVSSGQKTDAVCAFSSIKSNPAKCLAIVSDGRSGVITLPIPIEAAHAAQLRQASSLNLTLHDALLASWIGAPSDATSSGGASVTPAKANEDEEGFVRTSPRRQSARKKAEREVDAQRDVIADESHEMSN